MNKYEITTEKKKASIISSALTLFSEKGYTSVSIKEIAALASVSQVSIYNYFGSKEALLAECANIVVHDTLQRAAEILVKDICFVEKLKLALAICSEKLSNSVSEYFTKKALDDPALVELLIENLNCCKSKIYRDYIELGKQEGIIDRTIPTDTFLDFIEAINIMGGKMEFNHDTPTKVKHIHQLFLYGILGE